jgi:hypothetical protein
MYNDLKEISEDYDLSNEEAQEVNDIANELGLDYDDANDVRESL